MLVSEFNKPWIVGLVCIMGIEGGGVGVLCKQVHPPSASKNTYKMGSNYAENPRYLYDNKFMPPSQPNPIYTNGPSL